MLLASCQLKEKSANFTEARADSIYSEFAELSMMSYYWNDSYVSDYISVNLDTIEVTRDHEIPSYQEELDKIEHGLIRIKKGYRLLPVEEIERFTRLNVFKVQIYDEEFKFIGDGICSPELLINFSVPDIDYQKARFYDAQKLFIKKARQKLCKKYRLTDEELDDIVFYKLEMSRNDSIAQQLMHTQ